MKEKVEREGKALMRGGRKAHGEVAVDNTEGVLTL